MNANRISVRPNRTGMAPRRRRTTYLSKGRYHLVDRVFRCASPAHSRGRATGSPGSGGQAAANHLLSHTELSPSVKLPEATKPWTTALAPATGFEFTSGMVGRSAAVLSCACSQSGLDASRLTWALAWSMSEKRDGFLYANSGFGLPL